MVFFVAVALTGTSLNDAKNYALFGLLLRAVFKIRRDFQNSFTSVILSGCPLNILKSADINETKQNIAKYLQI